MSDPVRSQAHEQPSHRSAPPRRRRPPPSLKRGRPLTPGSVGFFHPQEPDRWIPGAQFRVPHKDMLLTVQVERYLQENRTPARGELVRGGRFGRRWKWTPERVRPEAVVVLVLDFEVVG